LFDYGKKSKKHFFFILTDISELSPQENSITGCICSNVHPIFHQLMILHYTIAVELDSRIYPTVPLDPLIENALLLNRHK